MHAVIHRRHLLVTVALSSLLALAGCRASEGYGPRSTMSDADASAACLDELSSLVVNSDADGLVAAFSEEARSADSDLAAKAAEVMSLMGGGTMEDGHVNEVGGSTHEGHIRIVSIATVTAPDGSVWQLHVTDCTLDRDDPARVGIRELQIIPNSDWDAPQGFGWDSTGLDNPAGIHLIRSWDGWDPHTSPYSPDW